MKTDINIWIDTCVLLSTKVFFSPTKQTGDPWDTLHTLKINKLEKSYDLFKNISISPLREKNDLSFVEICIPFTQGYFVPGLVEIGSIDFKSRQYIVTVTIVST